MWLPPKEIDLDLINQEDEAFRPTGNTPYLKIDNHVVASGRAERQFRAQFHGLLNKINAKNLDWIKIETFNFRSDVKEFIRKQGRKDEVLVESLNPHMSRDLKTKILYNLNWDLLLASDLQMAVSIDDLFAPLVNQKAQISRGIEPALGFSGLEVVVPNWSGLSWEEIFSLSIEADCGNCRWLNNARTVWHSASTI